MIFLQKKLKIAHIERAGKRLTNMPARYRERERNIHNPCFLEKEKNIPERERIIK